MKHLKTLGLTAVTATALMALVGASTASATDVLCENNTSTPCNQKVAVNGIITMEATTPVLTANVEVHCESSTVTFKVTKNDTTNGVTGDVTGLSWSTCRTVNLGWFNVNCTVTTQNLPYHAELITTGGSVADLTVKSGGPGTPGAHVVCAGFLNCTFLKTHFTMPIDSGNPASVTANEVPLEEVGEAGGCPEESLWDAKYIAESPTGALFVRSS